MPRLIPIGALVRVLPSAITQGPHRETNMEQTDQHGWLYIIEDSVGVDIGGPYYCRSLATGGTEVQWLLEEIEEAPTDA